MKFKVPITLYVDDGTIHFSIETEAGNKEAAIDQVNMLLSACQVAELSRAWPVDVWVSKTEEVTP